MPHAVTHVLIPIILLQLFRDYYIKKKDKRKFPLHYVLIGGVAGLLPDLDIAAFYVLSFFGYSLGEIHRTFSHTIFIPLFFVALAFVFYGFKSKKLGERHLKLRNIFLVIAFGSFIHLILDAIVAGVIAPFYPLSDFSFGFYLINIFPEAWRNSILPSLDAALLVLWLVYLEWKHKISSFI